MIGTEQAKKNKCDGDLHVIGIECEKSRGLPYFSAKIRRMKKLAAESIGTAMIMLVMLLSPAQWTPFATGAMWMALTYTGMGISGAHYNPATSLALMIQGKITRDEFPAYFVAQLAGAGFAALIAGFLISCTDHPTVLLHTNQMFCAIMAEFLGAFLLIYMYQHATQTTSTISQPFYGMIIGFAFMALHISLSSISGGYFNPALAFGAAIMGNIAWSDIWLYLVGGLLGAAAANTTFTLLHNE